MREMCREMSNSIKVIEMKSREKTRKEIKRVRIEEESKKNGVNLTVNVVLILSSRTNDPHV